MQENLLGGFRPECIIFEPSSDGRLAAAARALFLASSLACNLGFKRLSA